MLYADIASFVGPGAAGNRHRLIYSTRFEDFNHPQLKKALVKTANIILLTSHKRGLYAEFSNLGQPVRRCGSGNIAVAAFAKHYFGAGTASNGTCNWLLYTPFERVQIGCDKRSAWYLAQPAVQTPLDHPSLWQHILGCAYRAGCLCGGPGDYTLLEVSSPPMQIQPSLKRLCHYSRRALILMHRGAHNNASMRYFAPQYGPGEDAATGSAGIQAAAFLRHQYQQNRCQFTQQSARGGHFQSRWTVNGVQMRGAARSRIIGESSADTLALWLQH